MYAILTEEGRIAALKEYRCKTPMTPQDMLDAAVAQDYFLKEDFSETRIIIGIMEFTLVPQPDFDRTRQRDLAEALIKENTELDRIETCELGRNDALAVYSIPLVLHQKIMHHFPAAVLAPFCKPAIEMAFSLLPASGNLILLHITDQEFVLTGIRNQQLHICNAYPWHSPSDIVFFIQLTAELMQLESDPCDVLLTGGFETGSDLDRTLKQYVPGVRIPADQLRECFDTRGDKLPSWKYAFLSF